MNSFWIKKIYAVIIIFLLLITNVNSHEKFDCASDNTTKQCLQMILDNYVSNSETSGAVIFVKTPNFQWTGASGFADIERQIPMKTSDSLRIASMTKTLVAATLLKLSEEGKINLNAKITNYLPQDVATKIPNANKITIRQLLNMTSGIYNYTESDGYNLDVENNPYLPNWSTRDILAYIYDEKESFLPGTDWEYSNTNYILLDMIVAQISKTSMATEMSRLIFKPLAMDNSFMEIAQNRKGGFGGLHVRGYDEGEDVTEINDALGFADGGVISDAQGLAKFLTALFQEKTLLSQNSLTQMLEFDKNENYGLGISKTDTDFGITWEHNGSSAGFQGDMIYLPKQEVVFILLTNDFNTELKEPLFNKTLQLLLESHK